jgi:hypothetical protein
MFKELFSGISKFFSRKELVLAVVVLLVAIALLSYSNSKSFVMDGYQDGQRGALASYDPAQQPSMKEMPAQYVSEQFVDEEPRDEGFGNYAKKEINDPSELMPSGSGWDAFTSNTTPDLLSPITLNGLDTIGQTNKNPNYQLRSDPIIPKQDVGPWMQSTIEPNLMQVPLEIGYGPR